MNKKCNISHEEIAQKFVDSNVFNFEAMGQLVNELGPTLAVSDQGLHGVLFGRFNHIACMMPAADLAGLIGNLRSSGISAAVLEGLASD